MPTPQTTTGRLAAALALTLGLGIAQAQTAAPATTAPAANTTPATPGATAGTQGGSASTALSSDDRRFAEDAASDGAGEVMMGRLAQQRAASPEVRQYGERMVADHGKANETLMGLASARGLRLSDKPTAAQQRLHDGMAKQQGADFDRLYMAYMVDEHRKGIALFEKQASSGQDAGLKDFAQKTLATLQEHHKLANSVHEGVRQKSAR